MSQKGMVNDNYHGEFELRHVKVDERTSAKALCLMQLTSDLEIDQGLETPRLLCSDEGYGQENYCSR